MEFSKKFVLVPESDFSKHTPSKKQLSEFDKEMQKILNSDLQDFEKLPLYYDLLKRKMNLQDFNPPWKMDAAEKDETPKLVEDGIIENSANPEDNILKMIPVGVQKQAEQLLQYLKTYPNILRWNERGEIIYKDQLIPKSNLTDLICLILTQRKSYKHLFGRDEFLKALNSINAPKLFLKNKYLTMKDDVYSPIKNVKSIRKVKKTVLKSPVIRWQKLYK